jgi:hypothetical protein
MWQASVTRWVAHLVRNFLGDRYEHICFEEVWLCPSAKCHGLCAHIAGVSGDSAPIASLGEYTGTEFALDVGGGRVRRGDHVCDREGCWHQLGLGHSRESMRLRDGEEQVCSGCKQQARFALRAGAQFGWGHRTEAQQMLRGLGIVAGGQPGNSWVSSR